MADNPDETTAQRHGTGNDSVPSHALPLPRDTTPTWEVELLISGVAVFAMLQLPGWLDERILSFTPRLDQSWQQLLMALHMYLNSGAVILAATFVLHLLLRAQWIALVGLHSVYPDGIRWDRLRTGPIERRLSQQLTPSVEFAIERADNRATTVFAMGVTMAGICVTLSVAIGILFPLLMFVFHLAGYPIQPKAIFPLAIALLVGPYLLTHLIDQRFGQRIDPDGRWGKLFSRLYLVYSWIGFGRSRNTQLSIFSSHRGENTLTLLIVALLLSATLVVGLSIRYAREPESVGNYGLFPFAETGDVDSINPGHYANRRDPIRDALLPFIQSDMPRQQLLRLTVPYDPVRDAAALATCSLTAIPDGDDTTDADVKTVERLRRQELLSCLAKLHPVELDGQRVSDLRYASSSDDAADRPAIEAKIDIRSLPPGRHELLVYRPPRPSRDQRPESTQGVPAPDDGSMTSNPPHRIPFWR